MTHRPLHFLVITIALSAALAVAADRKSSSSNPPRISQQERVQILRSFATGLVYVRTYFPVGELGLTLKQGSLTPVGPELQRLIDTRGAAAKPGDLVRITAILFKDDHIHFEINGGPAKNPKWYQKMTISGPGGTITPGQKKNPNSPKESGPDSRGSYVDLYFDKYIPELTVSQLHQLLAPVFDLEAKTSVEAYIETVPPKVKEAIKEHHVLVGMNREMVVYAKGLPARKIREEKEGTQYEEWVFGEPPQDVEFVTFIGDEVVRIETMKINGEKSIRTEKEIDEGEHNKEVTKPPALSTPPDRVEPPPDKR
jgi:hypothetical protein